MGMDLYGRNPVSERGEYFRNNAWWWTPLWVYCCEVAPELCRDVSGHENVGDGLDALGAIELMEALHRELWSGATARYEKAYNETLSMLPRHECKWCNSTGVRTDEVGVDLGMPMRELEPEMQIIMGRTHGWCNACGGEGMVDDMRTKYPFTVENVVSFAEFLGDCGGFSIC